MPYATDAHIQSEFADITFTSSSKVTTADVTRFLAEADAEINTRLSTRYSVPITGTEALIVVRMIEIWLVKHRIQTIVKVKTPISKADQGGESDLREQALEMLNDLAEGKILLSDAETATSHEGVKSYAADEDLEHEFDRSTVQW